MIYSKILTTFQFVLLLIGLTFNLGCASLTARPDPPRITLINLQPLEIGILEQRVRLQLRIQNPNDFVFEINGMDYALAINDDELAYGVSNESVRVPAFGDAVINVDAVSSIFDVIRQLQKLGYEQQGRFQYKISGGVSLANRFGKIPFEYQGEINFSPTKVLDTPSR